MVVVWGQCDAWWYRGGTAAVWW